MVSTTKISTVVKAQEEVTVILLIPEIERGRERKEKGKTY